MDECTCNKWEKNYSSKPNWEYCPYCGGIIHKPEPKQPTHEEILKRLKRELNIQLDTKIADMKKVIIRHMNDLYDSIVPPEE